MCKNYEIFKVMKRFTILAIIAFCVLPHIMSQKISPIITMQDGREVNSEYAFLDGDICTFFTDNYEGFYWSFVLINKDSLMQVLHTEERTYAFTIAIHPDLAEWYYAKHYEEAGDSSVYIKGIVYLWNGQEKKDSMTIRLNVLPSKPEIIDISFIYTKYDWEYNDFCPNAEFNIAIRSARTNAYRARTGDPFYFSFPYDNKRYFRYENPFSSVEKKWIYAH